MHVLRIRRVSVLACQVFLVFISSFCHGENETVVEVVGAVECTDCTRNNIDISRTFAGLRVAINCKSTDEISRTRGIGKLDKRGNFKVSLPPEILNNGEMKENCVAKVYNALRAHCLTQNRLEASKIVFNHNGKRISGLTEKKLTFSSIRCVSGMFSLDAHVVYIPRPPPLPNYLNQPYNPPAAPGADTSIPSPIPPPDLPYSPPAPDLETPVSPPTPPLPAPTLAPTYEPPTPFGEPPPPLEATAPIPHETLTPSPTSEPLPSQGSTFNGPSLPPFPTETIKPPPTSDQPLPSQGSTFNGPALPPRFLSPPEPWFLPPPGPSFNEPSLPPAP